MRTLTEIESSALERPGIRNFDIRFTQWLAAHSVTLLRVGIGIVFLWFGALKFFPGLSPAEALVGQTIGKMTFGLVPPTVATIFTAALESLIGLGLLTGRYLRLTLLMLGMQMLGGLAPLFLFPEQTFASFPFVPTLEGQYILKNVVLIAGAMVVGSTVRGGRLTPED